MTVYTVTITPECLMFVLSNLYWLLTKLVFSIGNILRTLISFNCRKQITWCTKEVKVSITWMLT